MRQELIYVAPASTPPTIEEDTGPPVQTRHSYKPRGEAVSFFLGQTMRW